MIIYCMKHKLELAVHGPVKKITQASHFQMIIESLKMTTAFPDKRAIYNWAWSGNIQATPLQHEVSTLGGFGLSLAKRWVRPPGSFVTLETRMRGRGGLVIWLGDQEVVHDDAHLGPVHHWSWPADTLGCPGGRGWGSPHPLEWLSSLGHTHIWGFSTQNTIQRKGPMPPVTLR